MLEPLPLPPVEFSPDGFLPFLPYEWIGFLVVVVATLLIGLVLLGAGLFSVAFVWARGWGKVNEYLLSSYETHPKEERAPLWKLQIATVATGLSRFKPHKIPEALEKSREIARDDRSISVVLIEHLPIVTVDGSGGGSSVESNQEK